MIGEEEYQKVIVKFSKTCFMESSPLQSLYITFADKSEKLFDDFTDNKFYENWKDNLSIILSNRTENSGNLFIFLFP
jgi:hypothetical protein